MEHSFNSRGLQLPCWQTYSPKHSNTSRRRPAATSQGGSNLRRPLSMRRAFSSFLLGLLLLSLLLASPTTTALRLPSLGRSSLTSISYQLPDQAATLPHSSSSSNNNMSTDTSHPDSVDNSLHNGPQQQVTPTEAAAAPPASPLSSFYRECAALVQGGRIPRRKFLRELLAEALGTGIIVFFGTGAVMSAVVAGELVGLFQIAAVWIIAVTLAIATTANISGAHLNPAITLAFTLLRKFPRAKVLPYMVAQMVGSGLASWMNYMLYASKISAFEAAQDIVRSSAGAIGTAKCFGEYYLHPVSTAQAFLAEAFGTAVLAFCIFCLTHHRNDTTIHNVYIPPLIGATVGGLISVLAPLTQAGFNPARDFAPRIVAYAAGWTGVAFQQSWLYIVAPLVGAPIGGWVADALLFADDEEDTTKAPHVDEKVRLTED